MISPFVDTIVDMASVELSFTISFEQFIDLVDC